ncbi:MAG: (2Fe-2S)-binding protein [Peptostreptococcaceae bacterium]|nr:(2Fe-2S)-binding protein [Peptostreptococcaceae bacterium]
MVNLTINKEKVSVKEGTTILEAAKEIGIKIPTLCYLKNVNQTGSCRVCLVEVEGAQRLVTSCNTVVSEDMVINTRSEKVRKARRINVELLLSNHEVTCTSCVRSGNCELQTLSNTLGIIDNIYEKKIVKKPWDINFPLIRDNAKCISCLRCVQVCNNIQNVGVWDTVNSGGKTSVGVYGNKDINDSHCVLCGQCIVHCPVGALRVRDDTEIFRDMLHDESKVTIVQIAPAIRTAWGEDLGISSEVATVEKLITSLRRMGADYIFDTTFSADLTIMEEGMEFIHLLKEGDESKFPLYTSCCPAWVSFIKSNFPNSVKHLSTAKSPQQMFGTVIKEEVAKNMCIDRENINVVSIMPCLAKKAERELPTMKTNGDPDVDLVITTRELARMVKASFIDPAVLEEGQFDRIQGANVGDGTGAGVIFGATGGVMEASLRSVYAILTNEKPDPSKFYNVRPVDGNVGWREAKIDIGDKTLNIAIASGLANARKIVDAVEKGEKHYHFVEIMACPGGCVGGGGQPISHDFEISLFRGSTLYTLDKKADLRFSHENPSIISLYERRPDLVHELHTDHTKWDIPPNPFV